MPRPIVARCLPYGAVALVLLASAIGPTGAAEPAHDPLAWPEVTSSMRPWAYWWWMGSAVDRENLTRELTRYREAGMGGVHIIPIYGARGYEDRYLDYLSPSWMEMLAHAVSEARRLDMGVDMTTGTGWCFGSPNVPREQGAMRLEFKTFDMQPGKRLDQRFPTSGPAALQALVACGPEGRQIDLADQFAADGRLDWLPPAAGWTVLALSAKPTGQAVKRAAPGGQGPMLNPLCGDAIRNYLVRFTGAFASYRGPMPRAMYHDSFEYNVDWSPDLLAEFARRRGYRLQDELPAFFGRGDPDRAARVRGDYRETVSDMMTENFLPPWVGWCRERGILTRNQAHGSPGNLLDLYAAADIPETEMFHKDNDILVSKLASSAAHTMAKNLTSSETGTWLAEHFTETLADLKGLLDDLFVAGVNHLVYHGTCYSPDDAPWPGWLFYASTEMNPRNSIWRDVPALNAYIARCQSMLQSGRPDNELLLYWPIHDLWHNPSGTTMNLTVHHRDWLLGQPVGRLARQLWSRGFSFDFVSDRQLASARAAAGHIEMPGASYRVIVVPSCVHMPVDTLERLLALTHEGATVIFAQRLPDDVPGWGRLDDRRDELRGLVKRLTPMEPLADGLQQARLGAGRVLVGDVEAALREAGVARESLVDHPGLVFLRRVEGPVRQYFIANRGDQAVDAWVELGVAAKSAVLMDPASGRAGVARSRPSAPRRTEVFLQLMPGESIFVRLLGEAKIEGPAWTCWKPQGEPIEIAGTWHVEFIAGGPKLPSSYDASGLASWTERDDEAARRFAGTARYTIRFNAPVQAALSAHYLLDLGRVCQSARVRFNGQDRGVLIASPYRVEIDRLKAEGNTLEIEVTSVAANRIRDLDRRGVKWKIFHDINYVNLDYRPFDASAWPLRPSGLLGPVRLVRVAVND